MQFYPLFKVSLQIQEEKEAKQLPFPVLDFQQQNKT
jgi:hypothetical protein